MTPQQARTEDDCLELKRNNVSTEGFGFLVHKETVSIIQQRKGEGPENILIVPKEEFDVFVDMYPKG